MTQPTPQPLTILITGASSGFGAATARLLAARGHRLILVARRADRLWSLQAELHTPTHISPTDLTDPAAIERLFADLPPDFRRIDVLVNSAGLALGMEPAPHARLDHWQRMVDTNIQGLLSITHPVIKIMADQGSGLIINIGSMAASMPYPGGNVYGATKAFVRQFSRGLRADLLGTGVKVTNLEPGMAQTEFSQVRLGDDAKAAAVYTGMTPLSADDIARTIAWVIDQPPHVNIDNIEIWPLDQTYGPAAIHRA